MCVSALLGELCVTFGYCLPPGANRRLENSPPRTIDRFLDVVITMEGLDPRFCKHREEMRAIVERHFEIASRANSTQSPANPPAT